MGSPPALDIPRRPSQTVILSEAKDLHYGGDIRSRDPSLRSG
jgi:hypothetical protein